MDKTKTKPALLLLLSFLIPALILLPALAGLEITPFGDNTLAISDGNALYLNYLGYVGRAVKGQEGILYSFTKGLGGNMMGSWGWFLLNPFFALFACFDLTNYMQAYTWVSLLNFCLGGLTMYLLLRDLYGHKASCLIFSTAYALNGFMTANVFQMNFFTGVPTLPLMALGLRKILKDRNPLLYILSLAYALLTNFYFGFMLCVASVLFFVVALISERERIARKGAVLLKYVLSSGFAGALSSVVWLPALLSLRGGRLDQSVAHAVSFKENMPFLEMASKLFSGANSTAELTNGLPNIFVGILPVFLTILFFLDREVPKRKKTAAAVLLGVYLISFYIPAFNIAMHGGTVTNWFNYRDSFVFCFLLLMIAAEEWERIGTVPGERLKRAALVLAAITLVVFFKRYEFVTGGAVLLDLVILALMLLAIRMHRKDPVKNPRRIMAVIVLILMSMNLFLNYYYSTKSIQEWDKKESDYQQIVLPAGALKDAVQQYDGGFYRMEMGEQWSHSTGNDPMLYGYYGVGHGGSDERDFVRTELSKLGVRRFDMRNSYGAGVPAATDALLGLRYIVSKDDLAEEKGYERMVGIDAWSLYRNPYALPIAFAANTEIDGLTLDLEDIFDNLNRVWSAVSGGDAPIFLPEDDIVFESYNILDPIRMTGREAAALAQEADAKKAQQPSDSASDDSDSSDASASDQESRELLKRFADDKPPEDVSYIKYTVTVRRDGPVYSYNRSAMEDNRGSYLPVMEYEGFYHAGETFTRYIPFEGRTVTQPVFRDLAGRFRTVSVDMDALAGLSAEIQGRPSELRRISDRHLTGTVTLAEGQEFLFTIPYDEGWTLTVDGKETAIKQVLGLFMAAEVAPGAHTFEMKFLPAGLKPGACLSAIALLATAAYIPIDHRRGKRTALPETAAESVPAE